MQNKPSTSEKCILAVLVLLSMVAMCVKLFVGFDIDEGYAISMPQRLLNGEHLFLDMWEVHQTSAFLPAVFMLLFEKVTKSTVGIVLYLRIIATLLHLGMTLLVCHAMKNVEWKWRILLALLYFNFLPKWMISLDFSMQQIWGLTLTLYFLHCAISSKKSYMAFLTGIALAFTVLAYPGMVVLYPVIICIVLLLTKQNREIKRGFNICAYITLGCAAAAILFFGYLLMHMSLQELLKSIPLIFMDGTHQFTMTTKLMAYGKQWLNVLKQIAIFLVPVSVICVIVKKAVKECKTETVFLSVWMIVTSALVIFANVVGIQIGPFHFQVRYLGFFLICFVIAWKQRKQCTFLFWEIFVLNLAAFIGILIFSNVGPDASSSYLVLGVLGGFLLLCQSVHGEDEDTARDGAEHAREKKQDKGYMQKILWLACSVFVLSLIFCKGYYVRITEYGPSNILQQRIQMQEGPLKGIFLLPKDYERCTSDHRTVQEQTSQTDTMLFLGTEGILNLSANGSFVSPSTISTPAFNEQWKLYFTMYPEKMPDIIVLAKNTIDDREKFFDKNPFGIWIAENYDTMHRRETDSLCIIRK